MEETKLKKQNPDENRNDEKQHQFKANNETLELLYIVTFRECTLNPEGISRIEKARTIIITNIDIRARLLGCHLFFILLYEVED